jgi:hypothetical protein
MMSIAVSTSCSSDSQSARRWPAVLDRGGHALTENPSGRGEFTVTVDGSGSHPAGSGGDIQAFGLLVTPARHFFGAERAVKMAR